MLPVSIQYALIAFMCIGTADTINKRARQCAIPVSSYMLVQTPVFTCTVFVFALATSGISVTIIDALLAAIGAILSFAAFTVMLHSLTHGSAYVNYTIFRLSFVFSSTAALLFLNEELTRGKTAGILLATTAILLLGLKSSKPAVAKGAIGLALLAMCINAVFQVFLKISTSMYTSTPSFLLVMSMFFSIVVIGYYIVAGRPAIPASTFILAPANGFLAAIGTLAALYALSAGDASSVLPVVQLSFLATFVLSIILLKESSSVVRLVGVIFALCAILAITWL